MTTFIWFLPENVCREWRGSTITPWCGGSSEVAVKPCFQKKKRLKERKKNKNKIILGDDLKATVQFNCTLNTMATVKKMGILWVH